MFRLVYLNCCANNNEIINLVIILNDKNIIKLQKVNIFAN